MQHFKTLDALRGYMAWWVVLQHILQLSGASTFVNKYVYIVGASGGIAVSVFMMISGYVITHLLIAKQEPYPAYLIRRFWRIFPVYVVGIVFAVAISGIYGSVFVGHDWIAGSAERGIRLESERQNIWAHVALHATLLHGVIPDTVLPFSASAFLAPAWSLSLEWQYYLLAPVILLAITRHRLITLAAAVAAGGLVLMAVSGVWGGWSLPSNLLLVLHFFLIGGGTRLLLDPTAERRRDGWVSTTIGVLLLAVTNWGLDWFALLGTAAALVIWAIAIFFVMVERHAANFGPFIRKLGSVLFTNALIVEIGKVSYSTYLLHVPMLSVGLYLGLAVSGLATVPVNYFWLMVATTPLIFVASFASYRWIEKPGIALGSRISMTIGQKQSMRTV